jgi:hypothetical protein
MSRPVARARKVGHTFSLFNENPLNQLRQTHGGRPTYSKFSSAPRTRGFVSRPSLDGPATALEDPTAGCIDSMNFSLRAILLSSSELSLSCDCASALSRPANAMDSKE